MSSARMRWRSFSSGWKPASVRSRSSTCCTSSMYCVLMPASRTYISSVFRSAMTVCTSAVSVATFSCSPKYEVDHSENTPTTTTGISEIAIKRSISCRLSE